MSCRLKIISFLLILTFSTTLWAEDNIPSPLNIDKATKLFLERNLALISAHYQIDIAEAEAVTARLLPNPVFGFSSINITSNNPVIKDDPSPREFDYNFSQLIETAGKRRHRKAIANWGKEISKMGFEDALRNQLFNFRKAFYQVVVAQAAVDLAKEILKSYEDLTELNKTRFEVGEIAEEELIKVRLEKQRFETEVEQTLLDLKTAKNTLLAILRYTDFEQPVEIEERLSFRDVSLSLDKVRKAALTYRPDLMATQMRIEQAEESVDMAKAFRYPDLTAGATYQQIPGYPHDSTFGANLGVPLPVFNRNQGGIIKAKTELEKAKTDNELLMVTVVTEVENVFRTYKTKKQLVESFESIMRQAEKALDIAVYKYRQGASSLLELLEAQRTYYKIKGDYNKTLLDYQVSLEHIKFSTNRELEEIR